MYVSLYFRAPNAPYELNFLKYSCFAYLFSFRQFSKATIKKGADE
jgi:hypothetical protein